MSWFQSTNLASFAKTALKEAQKTIDKALDIKEDEDGSNNAGAKISGVTNAVDMASEFFASLGVGGSQKSSERSASPSEFGDSSTVATTSIPTQNRAISTPPTTRANVNMISQVNQDPVIPPQNSAHNSTSTFTSSFTSDNSVTLFAPPNTGDPPVLSDAQEETKSTTNHSKHTRSLSDTVFHSSDNNLGDLVLVLDDSNTTNTHLITSSGHSLSTDQQLPNKKQVESSNTHLVSSSVQVYPSDEILPTTMGVVNLLLDSSEEHKPASSILVDKKSNIELLQEIDLNGDKSQEKSVTATNISDEVQSSTVVESSLSEGWDWTESTAEEESSLSHDHGGESQFEAKDVKSLSANVIDMQSVNNNNQIASSPPLTPVVDEQRNEEIPDLLLQDANKPGKEEELIHHHESLDNSRTADVESHDTHDHHHHSSSPPPSPREDTPPSSARVSPNFEMVSSGCVNETHQQPSASASSRSSSIVVVSGRESTSNNGGSAAGSSGSSEGGHDVEAEIPQSPTQGSTASESASSFPRRGKHKKGASSSSSSSDIEVIPSSEYSLSPLSNNARCAPAIRNIPPSLHIATQTDCIELRECEIQTEVKDSNNDEGSSSSSAAAAAADLSKFVTAEVADILAEKEQEVQQLREEGEKLSLKQFELSQVIKKLRAKEKETEGVVKGLRTEIATKNLELEKLMKTFISKEGIEQSQNETISKLNGERRKLELRAEQLSSELEDARDNVESMKATVENASIEILELKNVIASVQRDSAEVDRLTREKAEVITRADSLQKEVDHLRTVVNTSQSRHHSREADLKSQISVLTTKVHALETSLADVSTEVADATMPLSMEIEKLQGELKHQQSQADRREQAMQSTILDLELKLKSSQEREKTAKELQIQFQSQHSSLELRIEELDSQNRALAEQMEQKDEVHEKRLEDRVTRIHKLEKTVERLTGEVERLSNENDSLSTELKAERSSFELERRKSQSVIDQLNRVNSHPHGHPHHHQHNRSMSTSSHHGSSQTLRNDNSPQSPRDHSPSEHSITSENSSYLDEVFDPNGGVMMMSTGGGGNNNRSMTPKSFFESFSSVGLIEGLQNQLRLREGEVIALQEEMSKNERIRKQLNEEIATLTVHNQQIAVELEKMSEMEHKLEEVNKNYNAVLQMYGEKVEEADELRMDLDDVKEMYKTQIEQLLKKS